MAVGVPAYLVITIGSRTGTPRGLDRWVAQLPADAEKLRILLDNLFSNAVKFSPESGVVAVVARVEGQHLTRLATATDVALACVYLASRESDVITGIDLPVSGGSTTARALQFG